MAPNLLLLKRRGLNNLSASMTRVCFLLDPYKAERCQYLDISLHGGTVPFENYRKVRNWCGLLAYCVDHSNSLLCENAKQIGRVFKGEPYLGGEFLTAIQPASALKRSPKEVYPARQC